MISFNVINWDFNTDKLYHYDIIPYLYGCIDKEGVIFDNKNTLKEFIDNRSKYQYLSRCQYECIVHGWPKHKSEHKLDIYEQIKMNLDNITELIWNDLYNE